MATTGENSGFKKLLEANGVWGSSAAVVEVGGGRVVGGWWAK